MPTLTLLSLLLLLALAGYALAGGGPRVPWLDDTVALPDTSADGPMGGDEDGV